MLNSITALSYGGNAMVFAVRGAAKSLHFRSISSPLIALMKHHFNSNSIALADPSQMFA